MTKQRLSGWGRTAWTVSDTVVPADVEAIRTVVAASPHRGVIARGLGRSYGAAAQNAGGSVLLMPGTAVGAPYSLDDNTGIVTAPAGMSLDDILRDSVPRGWFVPVTPGTRFVTVGGAIASDIHGKNHHFDGSFGQHVRSMRVLLSSGEIVRLSPEENAAWFWATVGGMGLTGVVLDAEIRTLKIGSSRVRVETERLTDFDAVVAAMSSDGADDTYRYSVAWVDLVATGRSMGRGVLTRGDHATAAEAGGGDDVLAYDPKVRLAAPPWVPNQLLNKLSIKAFNEVWYRKAPSRRHVGIESIPTFFHPLDGVRQWNTLYGSQGFIQYQFIVPLGQVEVLRRVIEAFSGQGVASFLAVLKRMGPQNAAPMSFPTEGWTLTLDMAAGLRGLPELLARVDTMVLDAGGRHYLAKDSHVAPSAVRRGYPRFAEWQEVRAEMDPTGRWNSDLARRLGLMEKG
ncbi:MAG: FAD-binding oxidoreductase [Actinobacteria bacterium]|nr:FAD-binding oxidoreductase [Actinomycetota bacterium]